MTNLFAMPATPCAGPSLLRMFMKNFIMVGGILSGFVGVLSRFN